MGLYIDTICGVSQSYGYTRKKYIFFGDDEVIPTTKTFWATHNGVQHFSSKKYTLDAFEELMSLQETEPVELWISVGRSNWWIYQGAYYRTTDDVFDPEVMKGMILSYWDRVNKREEKARMRARGEKPTRAKRGKSKKTNPRSDEPSADDCPYQVLGVTEKDSLSDIKRAYRLKVQAYHPDKVAGLGVELQLLAETMTKKINQAYALLKTAHKGR